MVAVIKITRKIKIKILNIGLAKNKLILLNLKIRRELNNWKRYLYFADTFIKSSKKLIKIKGILKKDNETLPSTFLKTADIKSYISINYCIFIFYMSSSSPSFKITVKSHSQSPKTNTTRKNSEDKVKSKSIEMERFNEKYIKLLDDLAYLMRKKKEFMKAKAYTNARDTISRIKEDISAPEQIKDLPGIGKSIYDRLVDFSENKSLSPMRGQDDVLAKKELLIFLQKNMV